MKKIRKGWAHDCRSDVIFYFEEVSIQTADEMSMAGGEHFIVETISCFEDHEKTTLYKKYVTPCVGSAVTLAANFNFVWPQSELVIKIREATSEESTQYHQARKFLENACDRECPSVSNVPRLIPEKAFKHDYDLDSSDRLESGCSGHGPLWFSNQKGSA